MASARERKNAMDERESQSRWVADLIRNKNATQWPESLVKLAGSWSDDDFPPIEEIRA
jgi:hypothetical protein